MQHLRFIDGLRAIAVTSVVYYHAGLAGMPGGFVGVDIFFVISGYLITGLLLNDLRQYDRIRLGAFFARRVRRLMPALMLVLMVTAIASAIILLPDELPRFRESLHAVVLITSNFHFLRQIGGYFAPGADTMPLLHTWSLAVEEQYYIIWPLLLLACWWLLRRAPAERREQSLVALFLTVFVLAFAANCYWSWHAQEFAFYMMPMRAWELMAGGILALVQDRMRLSPRQAGMLAIGGLAAVVVALLGIDANSVFPGWVALVPTLGTVALIAGLRQASPDSRLLRGLSWSPIVGLGLVSYSWYLWHWPVLTLARAQNLHQKDLERDIAAVVASLVLAYLTWRFLENPIRFDRPWLFARTRGTLAAGLIMSLLALAVGASAIHLGKTQTQARDLAWVAIVGPTNASETKCFTKGIGQLRVDQRECTYGNSALTPHTVFWGDSHTAHLNPLAEEVAADGSVLVRALPGCPPLPGVVVLHPRPDDDRECLEFNAFVLDEIRALAAQGLRNVVLSARWPSYPATHPTDPGGGAVYALTSQSDSPPPARGGDARSLRRAANEQDSLLVMQNALNRLLDTLTAEKLRVIVMGSVPELPFNGMNCLTRRGRDACFVSRASVELRQHNTQEILRKVTARREGAILLNPIDHFCDTNNCYAFRDGTLLYRDDDHISRPTARNLARDLRPLLR